MIWKGNRLIWIPFQINFLLKSIDFCLKSIFAFPNQLMRKSKEEEEEERLDWLGLFYNMAQPDPVWEEVAVLEGLATSWV